MVTHAGVGFKLKICSAETGTLRYERAKGAITSTNGGSVRLTYRWSKEGSGFMLIFRNGSAGEGCLAKTKFFLGLSLHYCAVLQNCAEGASELRLLVINESCSRVSGLSLVFKRNSIKQNPLSLNARASII